MEVKYSAIFPFFFLASIGGFKETFELLLSINQVIWNSASNILSFISEGPYKGHDCPRMPTPSIIYLYLKNIPKA
jgi:hypothetical protein